MTRRILGILAIILALAMALPASAALTVVQQWAPTSQGVWPAAKGTVWAKTAVTSIVGVSTTAGCFSVFFKFNSLSPGGDPPAGK